MAHFVNTHAEKLILVLVFMAIVAMWFYRPGDFTESCFRDLLIAFIAYWRGRSSLNGNAKKETK